MFYKNICLLQILIAIKKKYIIYNMQFYIFFWKWNNIILFNRFILFLLHTILKLFYTLSCLRNNFPCEGSFIPFPLYQGTFDFPCETAFSSLAPLLRCVRLFTPYQERRWGENCFAWKVIFLEFHLIFFSLSKIIWLFV